MATLQERIKERRTEKGFTLLELADAIGVKEATIQRYESGEIKNVKHETVVRLAEILGCSPQYLMGWVDVPNDIITREHVAYEKQILLNTFDTLNNAGKQKALEYIIDLAENERYQKENEYYVPAVLAASRPNKEMTDDDRIDLQNVLKLVEKQKQKESSGKKQD